ncbi:MAG TPA: radical SAM protein [Pyrinomonadaceae bacterium]|nr:radical SAM protein [Pyrinomonadaceae bacterium]
MDYLSPPDPSTSPADVYHEDQNQSELIAHLSEASGVSQDSVNKILEAFLSQEQSTDLTQFLTYGDLVRESIEQLRQTRSAFQKIDFSQSVPPRFPSHVQVQTIGGCNASCVMCAMSSTEIRQAQKGKMSLELFTKIITECSSFEECQDIALYLQNEPLLDPELAGKVRLTKELSDGRLTTRIVTNGNLLTPKRIDELLDAGIDVISVSLNALTAETYAKVMPGLEFARTLSNFECLLDKASSRILITLTFMVTATNEHEIEEAIAYWSERGVLCGAYGIGTMSGTVPNFPSVRAKSSRHLEGKECYLPLETTAIINNGDLLLCCTDWARRSVSGNVSTQSIYDIWHSEELSALRRQAIFNKFEHPICKKCLGQTRVPANLMYEGGPGTIYRIRH